MSSGFYKRYIPPPKSSKAEDKLAKRPAPEPVFSEKPAKRPTPEPESSNHPQRDLSKGQGGGKEMPFDASPVQKHGLTPLPQPLPAAEGPKALVSSALPDWIRNPTIASSFSSEPFKKLSLSPDIVSNLRKNGFTIANGLQTAMLPMLLPGAVGLKRDICVSAATGSGKTLAYVLPLIENLRDRPVRRLRGLIVVPTRELVNQARDTLESCSAGIGVKVETVVGNQSLKEERDQLIKKGQRYDPPAYKAEQEKEIDEDQDLMNWDFDAVLDPNDGFDRWSDHVLDYSSKFDILVCTPGRLVDHIQSTKGFSLEHVQWLVIDEADKLLDESFQQWVDVVMPQLHHLPPIDPEEEQLLKTFHIPRQREIRKIILSATMTRDVSKLMSLKLRWPRMVVLEGGKGIDELRDDQTAPSHEERLETPTTLFEFAMAVKKIEDKPLYLLQLLRGHSCAPTSEPLAKEGKAGIDAKDVSDTDDILDYDDSSSSDPTSLSGLESESQSPSSRKRSTTALLLKGPKTRDANKGSEPIRGTLVFTNSSESALRLARLLSLLLPSHSAQIAALTKVPSEKKGRKTLNAFRGGELSIVIATDLASRGLDIPNLSHVINYDLPTSLNSYVHRVGRTARAGKEGKATTLYEHRQGKWFWDNIAWTKSLARARKVARINVGLQASRDERDRYEEALQTVGREALGTFGHEKAS